MAPGFKRGGARGGSSTFSKKSFAKKRTSPDGDDDSAARVTKKAKGEDADNDDDAVPVVPELKTDENGDVYVSVCLYSAFPSTSHVLVQRERERERNANRCCNGETVEQQR